MTTNNTPNVSSNPLVIAGSYGEGALTGWQGCGTLTREQIIAALADAGLPAEWAPKSKSAIGYAGQVLSAYRNRGIIVRRARAAKWSDESKTVRAYRARWIVAQAHTANGVGDTAVKSSSPWRFTTVPTPSWLTATWPSPTRSPPSTRALWTRRF